jgi:hypothetical protein
MELPQSTAKVGPDPPWWGVGVHWTGAVFLWGASTAYDLFARKDDRAEYRIPVDRRADAPRKLAAQAFV